MIHSPFRRLRRGGRYHQSRGGIVAVAAEVVAVSEQFRRGLVGSTAGDECAGAVGYDEAAERRLARKVMFYRRVEIACAAGAAQFVLNVVNQCLEGQVDTVEGCGDVMLKELSDVLGAYCGPCAGLLKALVEGLKRQSGNHQVQQDDSDHQSGSKLGRTEVCQFQPGQFLHGQFSVGGGVPVH